MIELGAFVLAAAGLGLLCLAMDRHHRQAFGVSVPKRRAAVFRLAGTIALGGSFWLSVDGWGAAVGGVAWFGVLTAAGLSIVFALPYVTPRRAG